MPAIAAARALPRAALVVATDGERANAEALVVNGAANGVGEATHGRERDGDGAAVAAAPFRARACAWGDERAAVALNAEAAAALAEVAAPPSTPAVLADGGDRERSGAFDLVLLADCVYAAAATAELLRTAVRLLRRGEGQGECDDGGGGDAAPAVAGDATRGSATGEDEGDDGDDGGGAILCVWEHRDGHGHPEAAEAFVGMMTSARVRLVAHDVTSALRAAYDEAHAAIRAEARSARAGGDDHESEDGGRRATRGRENAGHGAYIHTEGSGGVAAADAAGQAERGGDAGRYASNSDDASGDGAAVFGDVSAAWPLRALLLRRRPARCFCSTPGPSQKDGKME